MQVRVLYFGVVRDLAKKLSDSLELPDGASLRDALDHCERGVSGLKAWSPSIAISVNQEYAGLELELHQGDEIALLPPVSGGLPASRTKLVREPIDTKSVVARVKHPEDGAAVIFEGVVRNNTRGRRALHLDYEAYDEMALQQMEQLATQALTQFEIRDLAIVHRLGRIEISETSVLIVVASAHRAAAFEACRWLIDTLKRTVPIWKKEYFEDGAVWAAGEPFPENLVTAARQL